MAPSALPRTPRSLADDLRSRSAGQITRLLRARPDLLQPWPTDLGQLARRAADDASVLEAMQALHTTELRVLEVFACLHEATPDEVVSVMPDDEEQVREAVTSLWTSALIWGGPKILRVTRAAQQAFGPFPCGLSATTGHRDEDTVREAADHTDPEDLRRWVWREPVSDHQHPLLVARGDRYVLDREDALLLRGGQYLPQAPRPPEPTSVAQSSGQSLWTALAGVRYVLGELGREALPVHASRGVSRRALSDRAAVMAVPVDDLMAWLELAAAAGLVGLSEDHCRPTAAAHAWLRAEPSQMWGTLIEGWLDSDRSLGACTPEDLGCLTTTTRPRTALHRRHILSVWPLDAGLEVDEARELVAWWRPRMHEAVDQVPEVVRELHLLGLLDAGHPVAALALLPDDVVAAAASVPAAEPGALIVQPDQTIIAPLNIDTSTWQLLQSLAHVESWGPVTMQRIDPSRLRTAVAGRNPEEVVAALTSASRTPVPQALEYAVRDAARTSPARIRRATVVEPAADDADSVRSLGFAEIGPGVFASELPVRNVIDLLDTVGVASATAEEHILAQPLERPVSRGVEEPTVARLVEHLLGPTTADLPDVPALSVPDLATLADACQAAIAAQGRVWIGYPDTDGQRTDLVEPIDLRSGRLTGWSLSAGRMITVPLSKIAAFGSADD